MKEKMLLVVMSIGFVVNTLWVALFAFCLLSFPGARPQTLVIFAVNVAGSILLGKAIVEECQYFVRRAATRKTLEKYYAETGAEIARLRGDES